MCTNRVTLSAVGLSLSFLDWLLEETMVVYFVMRDQGNNPLQTGRVDKNSDSHRMCARLDIRTNQKRNIKRLMNQLSLSVCY